MARGEFNDPDVSQSACYRLRSFRGVIVGIRALGYQLPRVVLSCVRFGAIRILLGS